MKIMRSVRALDGVNRASIALAFSAALRSSLVFTFSFLTFIGSCGCSPVLFRLPPLPDRPLPLQPDLSEGLQKIGQSTGLLVAKFYRDGDLFAFNSGLKDHLYVPPRISCVEMFYCRENVWLNTISTVRLT
jgi:hypothetical protein